MREIENWWSGYDESGGIPAPLAAEIEQALGGHLQTVLAAGTAAEGYIAARGLTENVRQLLTGTSYWTSRGYVQ